MIVRSIVPVVAAVKVYQFVWFSPPAGQSEPLQPSAEIPGPVEFPVIVAAEQIGVKFEQSVEKEIDDKEEKEKAQLEAREKEDEKIDALLDSQEKDLKKEADKTKKILESEEEDENAERENSKKDEEDA